MKKRKIEQFPTEEDYAKLLANHDRLKAYMDGTLTRTGTPEFEGARLKFEHETLVRIGQLYDCYLNGASATLKKDLEPLLAYLSPEDKMNEGDVNPLAFGECFIKMAKNSKHLPSPQLTQTYPPPRISAVLVWVQACAEKTVNDFMKNLSDKGSFPVTGGQKKSVDCSKIHSFPFSPAGLQTATRYFECLDKTKDGLIETNELDERFISMWDTRWRNYFDANGDGRIDKLEFFQGFSKHITSHDITLTGDYFLMTSPVPQSCSVTQAIRLVQASLDQRLEQEMTRFSNDFK